MNVKFTFTCAFLLLVSSILFGQEFSTVDIVKVSGKYEKEAIYFYSANWEEFRKLALERGVISDYELLRTATDSTNHFQLILITTYKDSLQFSKSEENFREIIKTVSPNGPKLLNSIQRKEFLEYVVGYNTYSIISGVKGSRK